MSKRVAHVTHYGTELPDAREGERVFFYGAGTFGIGVETLIVHEAPRDKLDLEWLHMNAFSRIAPGGTVLWMVDHD